MAFVFGLSSLVATTPLFLTQNASAATANVVINEVSTDSFPEWIELYAYTTTDISNWSIQLDDDLVAQRVIIPSGTTIAAGEHLVFEPVGTQLSNTGDTVKLYTNTSTLSDPPIDEVTVPGSVINTRSYARTTSGGATWGTSTQTRGSENYPAFAPATVSLTTTSPTTINATSASNIIELKGVITDTDRKSYTLTYTNLADNTTTTLQVGGNEADFTYNWDVTTLANSNYTTALNATDEYGNNSSSTPVSVLIDREAPIATIDSVPAEGTLFGGSSNTATSIVSVSDANLSGHTFSVSSSSGNPVPVVSGPTATPDGKFVYAWSIENEPSGTHSYSLTLTATDKAENEYSTTNTVSLEIDNTAPTASFAKNNFKQQGGSVQPKISTDDDTANFKWTADEDNIAELTYDEDTKEPVFRPTAAGTYTFYVVACDDLGNCTEDQKFSFTWIKPIPVLEPTVPETTLPNEIVVPAGLVATKFNTNKPATLGSSTDVAAQTSSSQTKDLDITSNTKNNESNAKKASYADAAPSNNIWWILLALAIAAASYYAYRNWKLERNEK